MRTLSTCQHNAHPRLHLKIHIFFCRIRWMKGAWLPVGGDPLGKSSTIGWLIIFILTWPLIEASMPFSDTLKYYAMLDM